MTTNSTPPSDQSYSQTPLTHVAPPPATPGAVKPALETAASLGHIALPKEAPQQAAKPLEPARVSYINIDHELDKIKNLNILDNKEGVHPRGGYYLLLLIPVVGWAVYGAIFYKCHQSHDKAEKILGSDYANKPVDDKIKILTKIIDDPEIHRLEKLKYRLERSKLEMVSNLNSNEKEIHKDLEAINKPWWTPVNRTALAFEILVDLAQNKLEEAEEGANYLHEKAYRGQADDPLNTMIGNEIAAICQQKIHKNPNCRLEEYEFRLLEKGLCLPNKDFDSDTFKECYKYVTDRYKNHIHYGYDINNTSDDFRHFLMNCPGAHNSDFDYARGKDSFFSSKTALTDKKDMALKSNTAEDKVQLARLLYCSSESDYNSKYYNSEYRKDNYAEVIALLLAKAERIKDLEASELGILGETYLHLSKKKPSYNKIGFEYLTRAIEKGDAMSCKVLAEYYEKNNSPVLALQYHIKRGELGDKNGFYRAGLCYEQGIGCDPDIAKAMEYYNKAPVESKTALAALSQKIELQKQTAELERLNKKSRPTSDA